MTISTFDDIQSSMKAQKVVLFEVEPYISLEDWTLVSGKTYAYQCTLPYTIDASDCSISAVREDDNIWYSQCSSVDACESMSSSYYYDSSSNILYVHDSDDTNPATKIICAYFWLFFVYNSSKRPIVRHDSSKPIFYEPILQEVGTIVRDTGDIISPSINSFSVGSAVFDNGRRENGTGFFDSIFYDYIWFGAQVRMLSGGENLPYSEYRIIGSFVVESIEKNFEQCTLRLTDNREFLKRSITNVVFDTTTYPNLEQGKEGAVIPLAWGQIYSFVPISIDKSTLDYKVANHRCLILRAYDNKDDIKVDVGFTKDNANGELVTTATPVGQLTIDFVGKVDDTVISGSVSMGSTKNVTLDADTWYRIAIWGKSDGTAEISVKLQNPDSNYLQDDRTWGAEAWLTDLTIGTTKTTSIGVSIPFKSSTAGTYVLLVDEKGSGTGTLDDAIICKTYELPGQIVRDICDTYINLSPTLYDLANLNQLDVNRPYPLGIVLTSDTNAETVFSSISIATFCDHKINRDGLLDFTIVHEAELTDLDIQEYDKFDFISANEILTIDNLRWKISVGYGHLIQENKWNYAIIEDTGVKYKYRTSVEETIETALVYKQDATAVVTLYSDMTSKLRANATIRARLKTLKSDLGDTISFSFDRFNKNAATPLLLRKVTEDWGRNEIIMELIT